MLRAPLLVGLALTFVWMGPVVAAPKDEAKKLFVKAKTEYNAGLYEDAARDFQAAYLAAEGREPALLFNVAQARRMNGQIAEAIMAYKAYLREAPTGPKRKLAEDRIEELSQGSHAATSTQVQKPRPPIARTDRDVDDPFADPFTDSDKVPVRHETPAKPRPESETSRISSTTVAAVATSGVSLIAAGVAYWLADSEYDAVKPQGCGVTLDCPRNANYVQMMDRASAALLVVGLAAGGVAIWSHSQDLKIQVGIAPGGVMVARSWSW
jgi:tetratricopeptide (TPR) repeat protein